MGITDKLNQMMSSMQSGAKNASTSAISWILKIITAVFVGLTFAMVGQQLFSYSTLSFVFVLVVVGAVLTKTLSSWSTGAVLIFDLICVLVALLLRMYILIAP